MNDPDNLLKRITRLTSEIETDYPELYRFLEEDPITLPGKAHPKVQKKELQDYLESLEQLLGKHLRTYKKANGLN
ncbi:hypothetical protein [Maribacter arenosus]|uniref:Uncharacterized protein n=1 Tax=Maribacter arenosus TaxID=1854708 RepID=A0ABR7V9Y3_9FLAO|nr:hypothetical protein [Maribacter arenosus]MBD0850173.1 hypothetical protein [Maribacter arenosus]